jgi:2-amino-4-hydroxy-6-hydroxymethyldihydropteridine diphosphokinase
MPDYGYIGLGCNRGHRAATLRAGLAALQQADLGVTAVSSFYLTEPELDPADEAAHHPWYANCVARISRLPEAGELLRICLQIEAEFGRVRHSTRTEPRTLDLDLLLYGDEVINKPDVQVPHPRLHVRRFVLLPMTEIAPGLKHPVEQATMSELLERLPNGKGVWFMTPPPDPATWRRDAGSGAR